MKRLHLTSLLIVSASLLAGGLVLADRRLRLC